MNDDYVIDPLDKSVHSTVHEYKNPHTGKKGVIGLSPVIGMNPSTVQNKANPREEFSGFFPKEIRKVMLSTNDFCFLHQLNQDCGFVAVAVPHIESPADMDLLDAHLDWTNEFGETASAIKQALQDKILTRNELNKIKKEFYEDFEKGQNIMTLLEGMCEPENNVTKINDTKG